MQHVRIAATLACIAYPASGMKGTNFEAAAFSVNELKKVVAESECIKLDELAPHRSMKDETVNGIMFKVAESDGVATGNFIDGHIYRLFMAASATSLTSELPLRISRITSRAL